MLIIAQKVMGIQTNDLAEFDRQAKIWVDIQKGQQEVISDNKVTIDKLNLKIRTNRNITIIVTPIIVGGSIYLGYKLREKWE